MPLCKDGLLIQIDKNTMGVVGSVYSYGSKSEAYCTTGRILTKVRIPNPTLLGKSLKTTRAGESCHDTCIANFHSWKAIFISIRVGNYFGHVIIVSCHSE